MKSECREQIKRLANEAAELNRKDPGSGYAYALGTVKGVAESRHMKPEEKIDQICEFLRTFEEAKEEQHAEDKTFDPCTAG